MLSKLNRLVSFKVSKDVYSFINTFCKKYDVSVSSFCQDCVSKAILEYDSIAHDVDRSGCPTPDLYYSKLAKFINASYDARRK